MIMENQVSDLNQGKPLIIGDPDSRLQRVQRLPAAAEEARRIAALLNTQPLIGSAATKEAFLRDMEAANLIHIAAHGDIATGEILFACKPGSKPSAKAQMLKMSDLMDRKMMAKLVVLSCCHSARGEIRAEGVVGIARSFLGAGARSVLVALWAIDDIHTLHFMEKFYKSLLGGKKANESLNMAMAAMREAGHIPQHWAPFVLIGDDVTVC